MFSSVVAIFALMLAVSIADGSPPGAKPAGSSAEERTATFRWFSTLGFPDVKGRKLVQIRSVGPASQQSGPPESGYGFLVDENGSQFTVITPELTTLTFRKNVLGAAAAETVTQEPADLAALARECLKDLRTPPESKLAEVVSLFECGLARRTRVFILAWCCWRNGLDQLAGELYDHAAQMPLTSGPNSGKRPTRPLRVLVAAEIAHGEMWQAILAFGNPSIPRTHLLERFERIVTKFPESEHCKRAAETAGLLRQMIKEDSEHASRIASRPFERMSRQQQIAELIFQLRDQNGGQFEQPGSCDIFLGREEHTPAHRLVRMGYDAVPELIEALEDKRFTRSVGYHRNFYFSHYVLRVGDCTEAILERIAAQPFWQAKSTFSYMSMDGMAAETKKKVEAWYAELRQKGEKQVLIEATQRGDSRQAERLVERYPDAALPALLSGIHPIGDSWSRGPLVALVGRIKSGDSLSFLLKEVSDGLSIYGRLAAARALHERDRSEGVQAMIAEWHGQGPIGGSRKKVPGRQHAELSEPELFPVAEFLAECGNVEAVRALAKDLRNRPLRLRVAVIDSFREPPTLKNSASASGEESKNPKKNAEAVAEAITDLLVAALDDTDEETGASGSRDGKAFSDPRICDLAGHMLHERDPARYSFDLSGSLGARNRSIIEIKNMWRKAHGLGSLAVPARRTIGLAPKEPVSRLIEEFVRGAGPRQQKVQREIEKVGLGALPAVSERLAKMSANEPSRLLLTRLANRLSCIVDEVVVQGAVKLDPALDGKLLAMKGKPLQADSFLELLTSLSKMGATNVGGMRVSLDREGDGTGMRLTVLFPQEAHATEALPVSTSSGQRKPPKGALKSWHWYESVMAGGETLLWLTGGNTHPHWSAEEDMSLPTALRAVCEADANRAIQIRVRLVPNFDR